MATEPPTPAVAVEEHPSDAGIAPASVPPLHLWVSDLRLGTARLGEARLESWPTAERRPIATIQARWMAASMTVLSQRSRVRCG